MLKSLMFSVVFTDDEAAYFVLFQVSWLHNGSPLEDSVTSTGGRVSVAAVSSSHAGLYTCTVENTAGIIQRNFSVTVLG